MAGIQNSIANAISGSTVGGGATPPTGDDLLDLYPGATGAYSVRLLRAEYAGAALRVRREDTNEETDIGFDASGNLDTSALIDFCSFTNGLVSVWYDQSGLGVNLVQDAETSQPKIYDVADGVIMDGGRPAMLLDGDDDNIKADITDLSAPVTGFFMRSYQTIGGTYIGLGMGGPASSWFDINNIGVFQSYFGTFSSSFPADTEQGLYTAIVDGGSSVVSYNGNEKTTTLSGSLIENICVGSMFGGSFYANIKAQELIFYPSNESGSKGDIEANMAGYFTDVVPLLDTYGGAAAAYSLRRLSSTYTGAPVAVRNGGGVVADIGFDVFGRLDIVELKEHCGSTNGTVATWYDQSGLGNDATQSDPLKQPKVFDGATGVVLENGEPALQFDGSNYYLQTSAISALDTDVQSAFVVATDNSGDSSLRNLWRSSYAQSSTLTGIFKTSTLTFHARSSSLSLIGVTNSLSANQSLISTLWSDSDVVSAKINGVDFTTNNNTGANIAPSGHNFTMLGSNSSAPGFFWQGTMQAFIIYPSDQDAAGNRTGIEDNIDKYYGITSEGFLDKYPGAAAAYSLRRLTRAYRGPLITARRTDGQLKDIYATSTGELDVVTLSAWSSGQDATVQVWFDQSGEGNHAEQTTPASQPKIYDAATGVVIQGGRSSINFDALTEQHFSTSSAVITSENACFIAVCETKSTGGNRGVVAALDGGNDGYELRYDGGLNANFAVNNSDINIPAANQFLWFTNYDGSTQLNSVDGDVSTVETTQTISVTSPLKVGRRLNPGNELYNWDGDIQEVIVYPSDQSSRRVGIEDDLAEYYNLKEYRLLDRYPGAAAAYSLRLLSTSYLSDPEPYAVRVRRSSDNEEADIGFDGFGNLNVSLLEDFCAGADGFVSRWFDQSGGGNDANQNDEGAQPQLVASGAVIVENGEPAIQTDGSDDTMSLTSTINFTDLTWLTVTKKADTASNGSVIFFGGGTNAYAGDDVDNRGNPFLQSPGASIIRNTLGNTSASGGEVNQHLAYYNRNGTNASGGLNGEVNTEATVATTAFGLTELFQYGSNYNYEGLVQELVLYNSSKKSDRTGIETNIDRHYKIGTLLLDKYPSAAAAYSLRLLSSSYEGPLVEVQRSVDGKTIDIYPDPFGVLDTATLSAFCNGLTGTVRTWYDQSGGGNDATQTDTLKQPKIYGDRTNLLLQSNQFDTTWFLNTASVTSGQIGYDGTNDAWLLNSTGTGFPRIEQTISASGTSTLSVYAKAATDGFMLIRTFGADAQVWFDLNNGDIVNSVGAQYVSSKTDNVGNGWYRCSVVFNGSLTSVRFYPASAFPVYSTSGNGIYIQDAQLETGSSATDYIETTTSAVTVSGVVTDNGKPALDFTSGNISLDKSSPVGFDNMDSFSLIMAGNFTLLENYDYNFTIVDTAGLDVILRNEDPTTFQAGAFSPGSGAIAVASSVGRHLIFAGYGTNAQLAIDSTSTTGTIDISSYGTSDALYINRVGSGLNAQAKYHEIIAYPSNQSPNRTGIESNINGFYEIYTPFTTGLLDDYPTAAAAYSLRALSSTYYNGATPYAIEVRRASDGATQNIGFDIEGNLDVNALSSFCSGTDGFIKTWYDQAGANDATQTDPLNQPKIVSNGSVLTDSYGKPEIDFDGTNHFLSNNALTTSQPTTVSLVGTYETGNGYFIDGTTVSNRQGIFVNAGEFAAYSTTTMSSGVSATANMRVHIYTLFNSTSSEIYVNSVGVSSQDVGTGVLNGIDIGQRYTNSFRLDGQIQEVVFWNSNQTTAGNRTGIESNINDHYDIYETGLLAEYPGAAAAYSVRQLRSFYDGPAIRVRRDSDDAELDIGFDENGDLDLVALGDFCKYTDGFVKVWYDQANTNDATQTTTGSQPKIYDSVAGVITENGKPAIESNGTTTKLSNFTVSLTGNYLITLVSKLNSAGSNMWLGTTANSGYWRAVDTGTSVTIRHNGETGGADFNVSVGTTQLLHTAQRVSTTMHYAQNGSDNTTAERATQGVTFDVSCLFDGYANQYEIDGTMQEVIIYASNQSTNRTGIESNINTYYSIY